MQTKGLIFVFCLWASASAEAFTHPPAQINLSETQFDCNIPAPNNFHVVSVGVSEVKLSWDHQADAAGGYRIRTYRTSDNALVNTQLKPQDDLSATVVGLESGVDYYSVINCRCRNGWESNLQVEIQYSTLIIDLIVDGYQAPSNTTSHCPMSENGAFCTFSSGDNVTHFKVEITPGVSRRFGIQRYVVNNKARVKIILRDSNEFHSIKFHCDPQAYTEPNCQAPNLFIRFEESVVAKFSVSIGEGVSPSLTIVCPNISGCTISREEYSPGRPGGSSGTIDRNGAKQSAASTASPNPFTETLDVFPAYPRAEKIAVQLFNLSGQKVLDQQFPGGQDQYTLSTQNLANGFYLLHIEADGNVQTLKVVKSE